MTGSSVFSINLTYLRIPTCPNYHMSIKKSQAILKHFIDLKFTVWFTLCSVNKTMFCDTKNFFQVDCQSRLSKHWPAVYPARVVLAESLRSFLDKLGKGIRKEERGKRKEERGKRKLKKVLSVTKHGFVFWAQRKPNAKLEIYKVFQDRLTFLNRHMIV